jgi:hypothetical protein
MKALSLLLLLGLLALPAFAQTAEEKAVSELSRKKFNWLIRKEADSLSRALDERVQYVHSNGWVQSKKEVLDDMKSGKLVYQAVTVKESTVRIYGQAAIVTGLGSFEGINSGTAFKLEMRYTEVYVKTPEGWKLASRHSNRVP